MKCETSCLEYIQVLNKTRMPNVYQRVSAKNTKNICTFLTNKHAAVTFLTGENKHVEPDQKQELIFLLQQYHKYNYKMP